MDDPYGTEQQGPPSDEPVLGEDARYLLVAAYELGAFDSDGRRSASRLCEQAKGRLADPNGVKRTLKDLVDVRLLKSATGRGGGYWLTEAGKKRAERIKR